MFDELFQKNKIKIIQPKNSACTAFKTTDEQITAREHELRMEFPSSYRQFAREVGLGWFDEILIRIPAAPDSDWMGRDLHQALEIDWLTDLATSSNVPFPRTGEEDVVTCFADTISTTTFFWLSSDRNDGDEYGIYCVAGEKVRRVCDNFLEFITKVCHGTRLEELGFDQSRKQKKANFELVDIPSVSPLNENYLQELISPASIEYADWTEKIYQLFEREMPEARDDFCLITNVVLSTPLIIQQPEWPEFVKLLIDKSPLYEDVAEDLYGERISYEDDDEGPLVDSWEEGEYTLLDLVFTVLSCPEALQQACWTELMDTAISACQTYHFVPKDYQKLLDAASEHPEYQRLADKLKSIMSI